MVSIDRNRAFEILESVKDPEIPVLSIIDMGIVRDFRIENDKAIVEITPTYSGCPAMKMIADEIILALQNSGLENVEVKTVLNPAWTTDWMNEAAKQRLKEFGISPPNKVQMTDLFQIRFENEKIPCPYCNSNNTNKTSEFSSTACKSLHYCKECLQAFEYFKCI
jgi:ring-1,2-phenylacetyl-CoA epoxidase subunit PaaD